MCIHSLRVTGLLNFLVVFWLTSYMGAPANAGEMVPIKGTFSGGIINANFDSEFTGQTSLIGKTFGSFDSATGIATWFTVSGDTITNVTTFFAFGDEIAPGMFLFVQEIAFTGGTGRWSLAAGAVTLTGTWNTATLEFEGFTDGTISRPDFREKPPGKP